MLFIFVFKQKTAYEMRISDWSSDVCSSDLHALPRPSLRRPRSPSHAPRPHHAAIQRHHRRGDEQYLPRHRPRRVARDPGHPAAPSTSSSRSFAMSNYLFAIFTFSFRRILPTIKTSEERLVGKEGVSAC